MKSKNDIKKPRLSIDRVFNIKGSGTIVTGTLISGTFHKGMEVVISPTYKKSRIRNLQAYKEEVEKALPGSRVALNLPGIEKKQLHRGDIVLGIKNKIETTKNIDAHLTLLPQLKKLPLKDRANLDFYCGTKEVLTKIILNNKKHLSSGENELVQFRFSEPITAYLGDRFILRIPSPPKTIGGGIILDPLARKHSFKEKEIAILLQRRKTFLLNELILTELEKILFLKKDSLLTNSNYDNEEIKEKVDSLRKEGKIICTNLWLIDKHFWHIQIKKLLNKLKKEHITHPLKKGFPLSRFQSFFHYLKPELFNHLIASQIRSRQLITEKGLIFLLDYQPKISPEKELLIAKILKSLKDNPTNPPDERNLISNIKGSKEIISFLIQEEKIIKLSEGILLEKNNYDMIKNKLVDFLKINGSVSIAQVRTLLKLSRKYIIPLLTKMDEENITKRQGNNRVLKSGSD